MDAIHPPKWPHTLNWPWSPTKHSDDSTHARPETFVGTEVIITEKLDGGNTCLFQGEVYARSVAGPSRDGWMAMVRKHHAWKTLTLSQDLVFNGEDLYGIHSITYEPMLESQTFRLFGVRSVERCANNPNMVMGWDYIEQAAAELEVPTVPVLFRGVFASTDAITNWFDTHLKEPSSIGGADREGFVIRLPGSILDWEEGAAKYIRPKHVQTDQHWRVNWQPCTLKEPE